MSRGSKIGLGTLAFGLAVGGVITALTGAPQLALHGGFWIAIVFGLWLEAHLPAQP